LFLLGLLGLLPKLNVVLVGDAIVLVGKIRK
jgi:hypothetical protein